MKAKFSVTIIGSGNVGSQLAKLFYKKGITIDAIYNKNQDSGISLSKAVKSSFVADKKNIPNHSSIYLIALKDDHYFEELKGINLAQKLIVHTSGSLESENLNSFSKRWGCLYPLQTLTKNDVIDWNKVAFYIEASNKEDENLMGYFCEKLELSYNKINSDQRRKLHISAVATNNFTYHLLSTIKSFCEEHELNYEDLKCLLQKSIDNAFEKEAFAMQTGPASRKDLKLVEHHLNLLENNSNLKEIYELFTKQILKKHHNHEL
ncbi:MAG: DUF2520 domain-containing protein [Flavobacteriales bacterium]|nr:DUF2520 domain-containing protein [Flavobacteriales bacterium]